MAIVVVAAEPDLPSKCSFTQKDSTFSHFYPITEIPGSHPDGFYAKIKVSSDYGDVHILLAESDDFENTNREYEFDKFLKDQSHNENIRRRNSCQ